MRMLFSIIVSLYTVRVVWKVLGIEDYGVYNIVGGIVTMFEFLRSAMITSSQRFYAYEIGRGGNELRKIFSLSLTVHFLLAVIILLIAETVGLWFVNYKLNIPTERYYAANWVYQCSVIAFLINVISVPYNACIVAHEKMNVYGYMGILEVSLKLLIVFMLMVIPGDKLIIYSVLVVSVYSLMRILYGIYCKRHFPECRYQYQIDRNLTKQMFSFIGWSFAGNLGYSVREQGLNIMLNMMFNVAVNAAKGIATQVGAVLSGFATNFQMALSPQITKRYASGDIRSMMDLVFAGCKYSVFLMMVIVVPLILAASTILKLWLNEIAPYTVGFVQLTLLLVLVESITNPLTTSIQATGQIRKYQIWVSIIMVSNIPISWCLLKIIPDPLLVMVVCILSCIIAIIVRLYILHGLIEFSYRAFLKRVVIRILAVFLIVSVASGGLYGMMSTKIESLLVLISYGVSSVALSIVIIYFVGLENAERSFVKRILKSKLPIN